MGSITLPTEAWAESQFGECDFGDVRRTRRAVRLAAQIANDSSGSTPRQTVVWSECKAAYRLIDREEVTFNAISQPHWRRTRAQTSGHWLLLGDTTECDFGVKRRVKGLGPTGDNEGLGFMLHSSLMVSADSEELVGLAAQELFYRRNRDKSESRHERMKRKRESEVWGRVIDAVGAAPENVRFTHVLDRGADNFEVYCHLASNKVDFVVRAAQLHRKLKTPEGEQVKLCDYLQSLKVLGSYELPVRARTGEAARKAVIEVRFGPLLVPAPIHQSAWTKQFGIKAVACWVIECREANPPPGATPVNWVLYTSHQTETFEDAMRIIGYYEKRWLIEEYHKSLKTGCQLEAHQYETSERLEAIAGFLSIVAVRLLQLKSVARNEPSRPAKDLLPRHWIEVLQTLRKRPRQTWTVRQFFRELAGLGGFLGRKGDGEPGWITIWRGFDKLVPALAYAENRHRCG